MANSVDIPISEVERITALSDPVLRNLQITQCYHELSLVMAERTGGSANWCTFATWASKQAGQTIRKEDLARALENPLEFAQEWEVDALKVAQNLQSAVRPIGLRLRVEEILAALWKAYDPQSAFDRSSAAVARGNLKVFSEIGREFARFYAECLPDPVFDPASIDRFTAQLKPGGPPDGQETLRGAFQHYYQALFETDEAVRVQLLLLANLEIGYHEQVRLQPDINEALTAPVLSPADFARNLFTVLSPNRAWVSSLGWAVLRVLGRLTDFDRAVAAYVSGAQRQVQFLVTRAMMTIDLAGRRLRLGEDLAVEFPPSLRRLTHPELLALLAQIDPTPDSPRQSGAEFWGDLQDRLHFIADMFRCFESSAELLQPPFSLDQTAALKEGRLPQGRL